MWCRKLRALSRRHALLATGLRSTYFEQFGFSASVDASAGGAPPAKRAKRSGGVKADELVLLYEKLLANLSDMRDLLGAHGEPAVLAALDARKAAAEAQRAFFIAESHARIAHFAPALALMQLVEERCAHARQQRQHGEEVGDEQRSALDELSTLEASARSARLVLHARAVLQQRGGEREAESALARLSLGSADAAASAPHSASSASASAPLSVAAASGPLLSRLDAFSAGPASAQWGLTEWPPAYAAVPCKPVLFDLAFNAIAYPQRLVAVPSNKAPSSGGDERADHAADPTEEEEERDEPAKSASRSAGLLSAVGGAVGGLGKLVGWRR